MAVGQRIMLHQMLRSKLACGEIGIFGDGTDLCIITYGNGYYLSRQVEKMLAGKHGLKIRIVDLRWLHPLNEGAILAAAKPCKNLLIVDEARRSGSLSEKLMTIFAEAGRGDAVSRITAEDCFIPLGPAAEVVLPSKAIDHRGGVSCDRERNHEGNCTRHLPRSRHL